MNGIVYLLTNPAMPGIVKIGKTTRESPTVRINELYTTGVPVPFECSLAVKVENEITVEQALHVAFGPYRINPRREFFQIDPEQAMSVLRVMGLEDVTPEVNAENEVIDRTDRDAGQRLKKKRRPPMNFEEMGIPIGYELLNNRSGKIAVVMEPKKVRFNDEICSLTQATRVAHELTPDYAIQPGPHWTFDGQNLTEIYDNTYSHIE
ncbi:MAG: GIY-YIG nuclease family protein [Hyphomicrobiales bacterium]